uniref:Fibronectin type-III domain-containing protein n=1 Tax=Tetraodon nigroviridis TaxID=99883 RepID=H3CHJ3_TETNG
MLVAAFAVLFLRLPRSDHAAAPPLAAPANVTMETMNTDYVLRWDWDQSWGQDVTFTTQYISHSKARNPHRQDQWEELCANLTHHSCDLSGAGLMYEGKYLVRVRAEADGSCSQWASLTFHPDKDARVGPPSRVSLSHADGAVDVHIEDPLSGANTSMRTLLPGLSYHILYWEGPGPPQSSQVQNLSSKATLVTLSGLGRTCYCVAVQTLNRYHPKKSSFTSPICIQTPGALVWWLSVLCFLGSMLGCFLLGFFFYKTSKWLQTVFFPASQLPSHFKEYLCDFPGSDMPRLLTSDAEQRCDKVVVCPRWPPEEQDPPPEAVAASPPGLEADSR